MVKKIKDVVEGNGDCGFLAAAKVIIDLYRRRQLDKSIARGDFDGLFAVYAQHYPSLIEPTLSPKENIDKLLSSLNPKTLISSLAFSMRQYAVDRMLAELENYQGAFCDNTEGTSPLDMRKPGTWIDGGALRALFSGLNVKAKVVMPNFTACIHGDNKGKGATSACAEFVELSLSGGHYSPVVAPETKEYFSAQTASSSIIPPKNVSYLDPTFDEVQSAIIERTIEAPDREAERQATRVLETFDVKSLLRLYRDKMSNSDYLPRKIEEVVADCNGDVTFAVAILEDVLPADTHVLKAQLVQALAKQVYVEPDYFDVIKDKAAVIANIQGRSGLFSHQPAVRDSRCSAQTQEAPSPVSQTPVLCA